MGGLGLTAPSAALPARPLVSLLGDSDSDDDFAALQSVPRVAAARARDSNSDSDEIEDVTGLRVWG